MGNSLCCGGVRQVEFDENVVDGTAAAGSAAATDAAAPLQANAPDATRDSANSGDRSSEVGSSEEAAAQNIALVLAQTQPSMAPPAGDPPSGSTSQHSLMITTINMLPAPTFEQRNLILQTPEEMTYDFQILSIIGRGAYGVVYRGVYQGGDVAIKLATINPEKSGWREAFVAAQLRHPHVVHTFTTRGARLTQEFFDRAWRAPAAAPPRLPPRPASTLPALPSGDGLGNPRKIRHERQGWRDVLSRVGASPDKGLLMLVQELCDKGNLASAITSGLFCTKDKSTRERMLARRMLLRTAAEICRGMIHLHQASVVHGDLKPANVLLHSSSADRRGFVAKIADFGLARVLEEDSTHVQSATEGTAAYMSPEVFVGVHSKAGDVYAFGVMLWEMMTGQKPYSMMNPGRILVAVSVHKSQPPWPEAEWPELCALGATCLAHQASERPTFRELEKQLVALEEAIRENSRRESEESHNHHQQQQQQQQQRGALCGSVTAEEAASETIVAATATAATGAGPSSSAALPPPPPSPALSAAAASLSATALSATTAAAAGSSSRDSGVAAHGGGTPGGGGSSAASPPPLSGPATTRDRHRLAEEGAASHDDHDVDDDGASGSCVAPPGQRHSRELRRRAAAAANAAAAIEAEAAEAAAAVAGGTAPWRVPLESSAADTGAAGAVGADEAGGAASVGEVAAAACADGDVADDAAAAAAASGVGVVMASPWATSAALMAAVQLEPQEEEEEEEEEEEVGMGAAVEGGTEGS
ncbi:hypothetical protein PLESTM_001824300 [Pleodorina starrii]|nr:hypothetical protein PLESTM_001824300 [Pleodorina starrii]